MCEGDVWVEFLQDKQSVKSAEFLNKLSNYRRFSS